jgi:hypothetical protein
MIAKNANLFRKVPVGIELIPKSRQLFLRTHNKTLSVAAMRAAIQIVRPHESTAETRRRFVTQTLRICNLTRAPVGSYRIYEQQGGIMMKETVVHFGTYVFPLVT